VVKFRALSVAKPHAATECSNSNERRLRLLMMAHVPPPYHGQSVIVNHLVEGFRAPSQSSFSCRLLDIRFSDDIASIGKPGAGKVLKLLGYAAALVRERIFHRPDLVYYVPAPGKRVAVYRDWVLFGLARVLGLRVVLHWLAGGLAEWCEHRALPPEKWLSRLVYGKVPLSILPVKCAAADADYFRPQSTRVIPTGIDDPCEDFEDVVLPLRRQRLRDRMQSGAGSSGTVFRVLFMAHCMREKGLFDAIEAVCLANQKQSGHGVGLTLDVYGEFLDAAEKKLFEAAIDQANEEFASSFPAVSLPCVRHLGFVSGKAKADVFAASDALCFPSYYPAEMIPTVVIDALAFGLPVISTDWRGIPELLPVDGLPVCPVGDAAAISGRLLEAISFAAFASYRQEYEKRFERCAMVRNISAAMTACAVDSQELAG
jgi:glycosyltransferase involved in cell wall biosynthesis